jgi:hypothetical protein
LQLQHLLRASLQPLFQNITRVEMAETAGEPKPMKPNTKIHERLPNLSENMSQLSRGSSDSLHNCSIFKFAGGVIYCAL